MDPDQTALKEQSDLGPHCLYRRLHGKNIRFVIMRFKG